MMRKEGDRFNYKGKQSAILFDDLAHVQVAQPFANES